MLKKIVKDFDKPFSISVIKTLGQKKYFSLSSLKALLYDALFFLIEYKKQENFYQKYKCEQLIIGKKIFVRLQKFYQFYKYLILKYILF